MIAATNHRAGPGVASALFSWRTAGNSAPSWVDVTGGFTHPAPSQVVRDFLEALDFADSIAGCTFAGLAHAHQSPEPRSRNGGLLPHARQPPVHRTYLTTFFDTDTEGHGDLSDT
jgi:hypothetical protein